jgi:hypothetical protein
MEENLTTGSQGGANPVRKTECLAGSDVAQDSGVDFNFRKPATRPARLNLFSLEAKHRSTGMPWNESRRTSQSHGDRLCPLQAKAWARASCLTVRQALGKTVIGPSAI